MTPSSIAPGDDLAAEPAQARVHRLLGLHVADAADPVVHQGEHVEGWPLRASSSRQVTLEEIAALAAEQDRVRLSPMDWFRSAADVAISALVGHGLADPGLARRWASAYASLGAASRGARSLVARGRGVRIAKVGHGARTSAVMPGGLGGPDRVGDLAGAPQRRHRGCPAAARKHRPAWLCRSTRGRSTWPGISA